MLHSDDELRQLGIDMSGLKPQVVAKLREKAADYSSCMAVAQKLTSLAYGMPNCPTPSDDISDALKQLGFTIAQGATRCVVCLELLDFGLFVAARRGKAEIETSHSNPRLHSADNVGFAHRACNIAQGNKSLDEFYSWIESILRRARPNMTM